MGNALILYRSKGGSTARYAQALARMTGGRALLAAQADGALLASAEQIVFASWMRAGALAGIGYLRRHAAQLRGKQLTLMAVGLSPQLDTAAWEDSIRRSLPDFPLEEIRTFYLRGAYSPAQRGPLTRGLLAAMGKTLQHKPDASAQELALAHDLLDGGDHVQEDALAAIALYLTGRPAIRPSIQASQASSTR